MKDEIKEIIQNLDFASGAFDYTLMPNKSKILLDYITNLQKENKLLRIHLNVMKEDSDNTQDRIERLNNIIKEVREFIEKYSIMYEHEIEPYKVVESEELLNILDKGSDKNDK